MAETNHVINIILRARDNTSAALASAAAKLDAFSALTQKNSREAQELGRQWEAANQKVIQSQRSLSDEAKKLGAANEDTLRKMTDLERAAASYQQARQASYATETQRVAAQTAALNALKDAEKALVDEIEKSNKKRQEQKRIDAEATAAALRNGAIVLEQEKSKLIVIGQVAEAERALAQERNRRAQEEKALQDSLLAADRRAFDERAQRAEREQQREEQALQRKKQRASEEEALQRRLGEMEARTHEDRARRAQQDAENEQRRAEAKRKHTEAEIADQQRLQDALEAMEQRNLQRDAEGRAELQQRRERDAQRQRDFQQQQESDERALQQALGEMESRRHDERVANWELEQRMARQSRADDEAEANAKLERERKLEQAINRRMAAERLGTRISEARDAGATIPDSAVTHVEVETRGADAELAKLATEISRLDGREVNIKAELDSARFFAESQAVKAEVRSMGDEANRGSGMLGILGGTLGALAGNIENGSNRIAAFDNMLRGLFTLGITVFFQQLIQVAGAAAGALIALASSAVQAGAALGGALAAGAVQAIPVIGVLATAFSRVGNVMNAVKQANLLQQQQSYQTTGQLGKQKTATDQVANAQDSLADAQRRVGESHQRVSEAQERLNQARFDAKRQLEDLIAAEQAADLAARRASLSQEEAQASLRRSLGGGSSLDVAGAQLGIDEASANADEAQRRARRAHEDASRAREAGVAGAPGVVAAQRGVRQAVEGVRDAERAVTRAQRSLEQAKRSSDQAQAGITAAAGKLQFLTANMSDSEESLYKALLRLQTRFHGFAKDVSEPIINTFTFAANRAYRLLADERIVGAARSLSSKVATELGGLFKSFTDDRSINQIARIAKQAGDNLRPARVAAQEFGHAFLNIGELGNKALKPLLGDLRDLAKRFRDYTESAKGQKQIGDFFSDGVKHIRAWAGLLQAVGRLFFAIINPEGAGGSKAGLTLVKDMTDGINRFATALKDPQSKTHEFFSTFFENSRKMLAEVLPIFGALAEEFRKTFGGEEGVGSVHGFATLMAEVLIPAIGDFVRKIGQATAAVGHFADAHPQIAKLGGTILALGLTFGVFGKVASLFSPITAALGFLGRNLFTVKKVADEAGEGMKLVFGGPIGRLVGNLVEKFGGGNGLSGVMSRLVGIIDRLVPGFGRFAALGAGPIALIVGGVVLLLAKFGLLDDMGRAIGKMFTNVWKQVREPLSSVIEAFQELWTALGDASKGGNGLFAVLKPLMQAFVFIAGFILSSLGTAIGHVLGGALNVLAGTIKFVVRLLSGDWKGALSAAGEVAKGLGKILLGLFELGFWTRIIGRFLGLIGRIFERLPGVAGDAIKGAGGAITRAFSGLGRLIGRAFEGAFKLGSNVGKWLLDTIGDGIRGAGRGLAALGRRVWNFIGDAIERSLRGYLRIGIWIRNAVDNGVDAIAGFLRRIGGRIWDFIEGRLRNSINNLKYIGKWIGSYIGDAVDAVRGVLGRIGRRIWKFIEDAFSTEIRGLLRIGHFIEDNLSKAIHDIGSGLENIGKRIIDAIIRGIKGAPNVLKDAINWLLDKVPGGSLVKKAMEGLSKINPFAKGGPVPGSGEGDTVPALLTPGEHVWTKREVQAAGGHAVLFALRRLLGGGGQGTGGRYALGGDVIPAAAGDQRAGNVLSVNVEADYDGQASKFRKFMQELVTTARRHTNEIQTQFREMRIGIEKSMAHISEEFHERWRRMEKFGIDSAHDLWMGVRSNVMNLQTTFFRGMSYISDTTNKALKAFDADPVKINLERPSGGAESKAGGGWVGNAGERGQDRILTWLGRGEAVLNWAQQKAVQANMRPGASLYDIVSGTSAYHAGGPGQAGYATGRIVPIPGFPGEEINASIVKLVVGLMKKYHGFITDAFDRDHSAGHKSPGHNVTGTAVDIVPGPGGSWESIEALGRWAVSKGMVVGYGAGVPGSQPWPGHGRGLHIHIEFGSGKGDADFSDTLDIPEIKTPKITGKSRALVGFLQKIMGKTASAARKLLAKQMPTGVDGSTSFDAVPSTGDAAKAVWDFYKGKGLSDAQVAAFIGNYVQESGIRPDADQPDGPGRGIAQWSEGGRWDTLLAYARSNKKSPLSLETQLNFSWHELTGSYSGALASLRKTHSIEEAAAVIAHQYEQAGVIGDRVGPARAAYNRFHGSSEGGKKEFAMGGEIPGPDGAPIPILAHAREWILNPRQQAKMAMMMGTTRDKLRGLLGFSGGPSSFAGGGEVNVLHIGDSLGVGIRDSLKKILGDGNVLTDALVGRNSDAAFAVLKKKLKDAYTSVFFDVGTNDAHASSLAKNLKRAYAALGKDQKLFVSTVEGPGAAEKNKVIRDFASTHSRAQVVDWAGKDEGMLGPDKIHATVAGYKARAKMVADAIKEGAGQSGESGRRAATRTGAYALPTILETFIDLGAIQAEVSRFRTAQKNLSMKSNTWRKNLGQFIKNIAAFSDESGLIDQLNNQVQAISDAGERALALAQVGLKRVGAGLKGRLAKLQERGVLDTTAPEGQIEQADMQLASLASQRTVLHQVRDTASSSLADVQKQLERLRGGKGGVTKGEEKQYQQLLAERKRLVDAVDKADSDLATNLAARAQARREKFEAETAKALAPSQNKLDALEGAQGIADAQGAGSFRQSELSQARLAALQENLAATNQRAAEAARAGYTDMAKSLQDSARQLATSIAQEQQRQIQLTIDNINATAEAANRRLDLRGRLADVQALMDPVAAAQNREQINRERGGVLASQRAGLVGALGGEGAYQWLKTLPIGALNDTQKSLIEQIDDLDVSVQENTAQQKELAVATTQARIDQVNARAQFGTGVGGSIVGIINKIGAATGQVDVQGVAATLRQTGEFLAKQGTDLRDQFAKITGTALSADPATQVAQVRSILANWDTITAGMTDSQKKQLEDLTTAILGNTDATLDNSEQLKTVLGQNQSQSFSSATWRAFRQAIFSGSGGLLPDYQIPGMQTGGYVTKGGLFNLHAGEFVVNPQQSNIPTQEGDVNVNVHMVRERADPMEIAARTMWARRSAGRR